MWCFMVELNIDKLSDDKLDFGQFALHSILGLHWDAFAALFSMTGSGFHVSPDKGCLT